MIRYCLTIFLSAFLMFLIQPLAARIMLPGFGGTASVWTTSMMFFQIALLIGYLYAHLLLTLLPAKTTALTHGLLAIFAGAFINFDALSVAANSTNDLSWAVTQRLWFSIGGAFIVLASTSPLLSAWFAITHNRKNVYRLYAMSNLGSMLGLLAYPVVVERFGLTLQSDVWRWAYLLLTGGLIVCGWQVARQKSPTKESPDIETKNAERENLPAFTVFAWIAFSASASLLMIAVANIMSQEVAAHPLLWVAPLAVYLVSIIICFEKPSWYWRSILVPLMVIGTFATILLFHLGTNAGLKLQVTGYLLLLFAGTLVCHGELYRLRPPATKLTSFYLAMAFGGAIGGVFGAVIAPRIFSGFFEFHCAIILCLAIPTVLGFTVRSNRQTPSRTAYIYCFLTFIGLAPVLCSLLFFTQSQFRQSLVYEARNAYGIVSVTQKDGYRKMFNGQTNHGGQFIDPEKAQQPSAYYSTGSGVEAAFELARISKQKLKVGVIGLGTGSMLAYANPHDQFTFYEINELSETAARKYFSFLDNKNANVVIGDGRIELQREFDKNGSKQFDLLFLDAFSSDSIPIHLLTNEAVELYLQHLKPNGCLIFHITNRFVDLQPVIGAIVDKQTLYSVLILHENQRFDIQTRWIVVARNADALSGISIDNRSGDTDTTAPKKLLWTDDCAPIIPIVKWSNEIRSLK